MNYEDEAFVKIYTRDTAEWLDLPWQARGLMMEIVRKVDRAGILKVGKLGLRGIALMVRAPFEEIEPSLSLLIGGGRIVWHEARGEVIVPNHVEAQTSTQTDAARKRRSREGARALAMGEDLSRPVTPGHAESREVTPSHSRLDQIRSDERESARAAVESPEPDPEPAGPVAAYVAAASSGRPPADIPITPEIVDACKMVGAPPPTRDHVQLMLATRRLSKKAFGEPTGEIVAWMIRQKGFDRDKPRGPHLRAVPDTPPAPYHAIVRGYERPPGWEGDRGAGASQILAMLGGGP